MLLYSWRFFRYSAPIHWLVHGHTTSNNETFPPNAMSGQHCEDYDVKQETVHCYPRNVDRCCTWSLESQGGLQNLLLFCFAICMGYWPSVRSRWLDIGQDLFLRVYGPRRSRARPISSYLDRTKLVNKGFIIWLSGKFFLRDTAGSPERVRWLHLTRSCSQSHGAIWFILPAYGASHIINVHYYYGIKNIGHHARLKEHEHLFYYRA